MAGIFISYRERDSKGWALSLRDRLVDEFGEARVFLDKDTLKAGNMERLNRASFGRLQYRSRGDRAWLAECPRR